MKNWIVLILLVFMMSSCIISLHPLYDTQTMVKEMKLDGEWLDKFSETPSQWLFKAKKTDKGQFTGKYQLAHTSCGYTYDYEAVLLQLEGTYYLDVLLEGQTQMDTKDDGPMLAQFIPSHNFYKLEFRKNGDLLVYSFNGDRLEKMVAQRKIRIKHEQVDGMMVITATTQELQKFLSKYAQDEKAFEAPLVIEKS